MILNMKLTTKNNQNIWTFNKPTLKTPTTKQVYLFNFVILKYGIIGRLFNVIIMFCHNFFLLNIN